MPGSRASEHPACRQEDLIIRIVLIGSAYLSSYRLNRFDKAHCSDDGFSPLRIWTRFFAQSIYHMHVPPNLGLQ